MHKHAWRWMKLTLDESYHGIAGFSNPDCWICIECGAVDFSAAKGNMPKARSFKKLPSFLHAIVRYVHES